MTDYREKIDEILLEFDLVPSDAHLGKKVRVYINPPSKTIAKIIEETKEIGGFLVGKKLYIWDRDHIDHENIAKIYGIKMGSTRNPRNPIPFYIINGTLMLSPSSYMGADPQKDMIKIQKNKAALSKLPIDMRYFKNY